jgi:hypothetical protein
MYYKRIIVGIFASIAMASSASAQVYERSKKYSQTYPLKAETEVSISNKYGNIHVNVWNQDSVRIEVDVRVSANRQARVDRTFNDIDVQFTANLNYVVVNTVFTSSGGVLTELSDLGRSLINSGGITEINYKVWIPSKTNLKLENRFGNIYTTDHSGRIELRVSNGDMQVNELSGKSVVTVEFGNASIRRLADARIELNYATLDLNQSGTLFLDGRSSTINIQKVNSLQLNSRRDRIIIDEAAVITGETSFSRANINAITGHIMLKGNYGNINVSGLSSAFQYMQLNTSFTTVQLYLHSAASANLEVNYSKRTRLIYPQDMKAVENIEIEAAGEAGILRGVFGDGRQSSLKFTMSGGEISVFSKP